MNDPRENPHREYRPLVALFAALAAGVTLDRYMVSRESVRRVWTDAPVEYGMFWHTHGMTLWWAAFFVAVAAWWWLFRSGRLRCATVAILVCVAAAGGVWHHLYWNYYPASEIGFHVLEDGLTLSQVEAEVVRPPRKTVLLPDSVLAKMVPGAAGETEHHDAGTSGQDARKSADFLVSTQLDVRVRRVREGRNWRAASGNLAVRVSGVLEDVHAGDRVILSGKLVRPSPPMNPGGFAADVYYRNERVLAILRVPSAGNVEVVRRPDVWGLFRTVEFLRDAGRTQLEKHLTTEQVPLAQALILGCREEISQEDNQILMETGTIHLLAISGLHVGILGGGFFLILRLLGFRRGTISVMVITTVILYVLITGARPPAVRAGILVCVGVLAFSQFRHASQMNTLAAAGIAVLCYNPTAFFATGTQLSFLAVAALVNTPVMELNLLQGESGGRGRAGRDGGRKRKRAVWEIWLVNPRDWRTLTGALAASWGVKLWNMFYASVVMMLVLAPLIAARFHVVAVIGILLNLLLWVPLFVTMMAGAGVLVLSWILPPVGSVLGMLCSGGLAVMQWMIAAGSGVRHHCFWIPGFPVWWMVVFYLMLTATQFPQLARLKISPRVKWGVMATWVAMGIFVSGMLGGGENGTHFAGTGVSPEQMRHAAQETHPAGEMRCSFISVGHGLAILLELPDGGRFLYDAGQFSTPAYPVRTISEYLWNRGVTRLDGLFLSHPDMDHFNAVPGILERFPVARVYVPPQMFQDVERARAENAVHLLASMNSQKTETAAVNRDTEKMDVERFFEDHKKRETPDRVMLARLYADLKRRGVPITEIHAGHRVELMPQCAVDVLHPPADAAPENSNAGSLVLLVRYGEFRFLITGDLGPPGTREMLATVQPLERCDVMLSPHHGGRTCNTPELAFWARPTRVVIAESAAYPQEYTVKLYENFGAEVFHTGKIGAVIFVIQDGKLRVLRRDDTFPKKITQTAESGV